MLPRQSVASSFVRFPQLARSTPGVASRDLRFSHTAVAIISRYTQLSGCRVARVVCLFSLPKVLRICYTIFGPRNGRQALRALLLLLLV